jgi:hypothetical protein
LQSSVFPAAELAFGSKTGRKQCFLLPDFFYLAAQPQGANPISTEFKVLPRGKSYFTTD